MFVIIIGIIFKFINYIYYCRYIVYIIIHFIFNHNLHLPMYLHNVSNFVDNVGFIIEPISVNDVQNEPSSASNNMQNKPYTATNVQNNSFVESDETFYTNLLPQSTTATNDYNDVSNYTYHSMQTPNVHPSVLKSNPDIQVIYKIVKIITNLLYLSKNTKCFYV